MELKKEKLTEEDIDGLQAARPPSVENPHLFPAQVHKGQVQEGHHAKN